MSIEAFIWNYQSGVPIGFDYGTIRELLAMDDANGIDEHGCLRVQFRDPNDSVDVFLGKDALTTNHTDGIMISRPIVHPEFLQRVFRVMELGDVMLFYSDETTPVFVRGADAGQHPKELLESLGVPRYVSSPAELRHQT